LNGQTVAQVQAEANAVLGGGTGTYGLTVCQLDRLVFELNLSFNGCASDSFAQAHLVAPSGVLNHPPVAKCKNVTVSAGLGCMANASIDDGSFDPDACDSITLGQSPAGPYSPGLTTVTLTVTDNHGASSNCTATVTVTVTNTMP